MTCQLYEMQKTDQQEILRAALELIADEGYGSSLSMRALRAPAE